MIVARLAPGGRRERRRSGSRIRCLPDFSPFFKESSTESGTGTCRRRQPSLWQTNRKLLTNDERQHAGVGLGICQGSHTFAAVARGSLLAWAPPDFVPLIGDRAGKG